MRENPSNISKAALPLDSINFFSVGVLLLCTTNELVKVYVGKAVSHKPSLVCVPNPLLPYFLQGKELLSQKVPVWQQACAEPNKLPDRAMFLAQQMSSAAGTIAPGAHHPGMPISEPLPGAKPLPVPPELAALRASGALGQQVCFSTVMTDVIYLFKDLTSFLRLYNMNLNLIVGFDSETQC